tara:strand:+ start:919 stop:2235 length:1317 start_codon:yes stop_codon:yes gene_type:complete
MQIAASLPALSARRPEHLLKDYLMPLSEKNPSAAVDAPAMSMAAMSLSEPSKISPTSAEPKVQLLRRESRVQNDRRKPPPKHTPEEEEARMKQKLEDYEAARSRIFGSEAPPPDTTSSSKGEGSPTPRRSSSEGSRLARCGGIDGDEGGSSLDPVSSVGAGAEGGNDCGSKRATNRSLSQRSQDMNDPDFNRRRWAPANQTVLPHYACGAGYSMPLQCGGGSPYGVGGYVPVAGGVHSMGGSGCGVPMYSQCAGSQAGGTQLGHPMQCVSQPWQQPFLSSSSGQFAPISAAPGATGGSQGVSQVPVAPYNCFAAIGVGAGGGTMQGGMLPPACSMAIAQAQNQKLPAAQLDGYGPPPLQPQPQQLQPQQLQPQLLQQQQPIVGMPKLPLPVSDGVVSGAGAGAGAYSGCLLPIPDYKAMGFLSTSPLQEQAQLPGPQE